MHAFTLTFIFTFLKSFHILSCIYCSFFFFLNLIFAIWYPWTVGSFKIQIILLKTQISPIVPSAAAHSKRSCLIHSSQMVWDDTTHQRLWLTVRRLIRGKTDHRKEHVSISADDPSPQAKKENECEAILQKLQVLWLQLYLRCLKLSA